MNIIEIQENDIIGACIKCGYLVAKKFSTQETNFYVIRYWLLVLWTIIMHL